MSADSAEALEDVSEDVRHTILDSLDVQQRVDVLDEATEDDQQEYVEEQPVAELVELVDAMPADEAADILEHVDKEKAEAVIAGLEPEHAEDVRELREYEPETAGGLMTTEFFWARPEEECGEILKRLRQEVEEVETIHEIFVCREDMKLKGQISVEELLGADPKSTAGEHADKATITIGARADQEVAARYMQKYDLDVLAVIDPGRRMLGIITVDDILDVLSEEASEDMYRMAGVGDAKPLEHGPLQRAYKRLPWLITTVVGMGVVAPFIMHVLFAQTLKSIVILALFIPAIMGLGGNAAIQSATITVRGLATGEIDFSDLWWLLWREVVVGLLIAVVCSAAIGLCAYGIVRHSNAQRALPGPADLTAMADAVTEHLDGERRLSPSHFGFTVGAALFVGILLSVLLGTLVPMLCHRWGFDPAVASGPFITTLIDIGTQTLYLGLATWILLS